MEEEAELSRSRKRADGQRRHLSIEPPLQQLLLHHLVLAQALQWQEHRRAVAEAAWRPEDEEEEEKRSAPTGSSRRRRRRRKRACPGGGDGTRFVDGHRNRSLNNDKNWKQYGGGAAALRFSFVDLSSAPTTPR